jgi:N-terminal domain on NACHT_NTPase and P-loop NTPases
MSGAEAGFIVGLISGVISIIKSSKTVYDATKDTKGQPEAFRQVAARLPLATEILHSAKERTQTLAQEALEPLLKSCKAKAENLKNIFQKVIRKDNDKWHDRDKEPLGTLGKVENVMGEIFIQVLACERLMGSVTDAQMEEAIKQMREMPSSLLNEAGDAEGFNQPWPEKVAFSTDCTRLALACRDMTVQLWDATMGKWQTLVGRTDSDTSVAFSTDGTRLASASYGKTVQLWDTTMWECLQMLEGKETVLEKAYPDTLRGMKALAPSLDSKGKYAEFDKTNPQTLEQRKGIPGDGHPKEIDDAVMSSVAKRVDGRLHRNVGSSSAGKQ